MRSRKLEGAFASVAVLVLAVGGAVASGCGKSKSSANGSGSPVATTTTPTPSATPSEIPRNDGGVVAPGKGCTGATASTFTPQTNVPAAPAVTLPPGFKIEVLVAIDAPRHIVALPNGDLLVGTQGDTLYIVPGAEADGPSGAPKTFAIMPERHAHGVAFAPESCTIYAACPQGIYALPYSDGATQATPAAPIAKVRVASAVEGHITTSLAFTANTLFASVGSSCNACVETDPTRATVQTLAPDGANMATKAKRIRNAIALSVNGETGSVWAGGAGQDDLPAGHPYEFLDPISLHPGVIDYGWPDCEENRVAYKSGADCSNVIVPRLVVPAYATLMSAAFYPTNQSGTYAFPAAWRGLFLSAHGSWHVENGKYVSLPRVTFTAMQGDDPKTPVDWNDPNKQHTEFISGFQLDDGNTRVGRPSGMAVGPRGTLFVADDHRGMVYRIRPQ